MEDNFGSIAEAIEQRQHAIIEALRREQQAIDQVSATLGERMKRQVESVLNGLKQDTLQHEKRLFAASRKQYIQQLKRLSSEIDGEMNDILVVTGKARRNQAEVSLLLPITWIFFLFIGAGIGSWLSESSLPKPIISLNQNKIAYGGEENKTLFYPIDQLPIKVIIDEKRHKKE